MTGLRVSAISFLNTAPLMWDFEHGDAARDFQIEYTVPAACAAALAANEADIGIIPTFTYAEIPDLVIVPNIAIAAKDRVRSILLVGRKPIEDVRSVATDSSSRTSVALLQVLFVKFLGGPRQLTSHLPDLEAMLRQHDAALLIGDAALQVRSNSGYYLYDLAHEWRERTGSPFVFAFWAVRLDALVRLPHGIDLAKVFQSSRDHGLRPESLNTIATEWSAKLTLSANDIRQYLTENVHYYLDQENQAGLQLFLQYARELDLIRKVPELRFLGPVLCGAADK
jgi:chorismate dehydratase